MNNVSTSIDSTTTQAQNVPSEKFINFLIKSSTENAATPEEAYHNLIEATWAKATVDTRKRVPLNELAASYAKQHTELSARIREAQTVMANTLFKLRHMEIPEELKWAFQRSQHINIVGVFRQKTQYNQTSFVNITASAGNPAAELQPTDIVKFTIGNGGTEFSIELRYLNGDPIAVAQMVRRKVKIYNEKLNRNKVASIRKKQTELQKSIDALTKQLEQAKLDAAPKEPKVVKPDSRLVTA